ncbi:phosphatase PAP2 family protein [Maribacter sp. 2307ULW6-5]|uniref:phosphatase PAP2 family protein n=1 Tax=Maribacter sp. 2307ULW6-5 TaxID=3386275 RepID=UPI0039BCAF8B
MEELLHLDRELFLYLNGLGTPAWDNLWQFVSHKLSSVPLYVFLLVIAHWKLGLKNTLWAVVAVALLITVSDQLSNFFKLGVARPRPCHDGSLMEVMRLVKSRCGGKYGYFSAHASNSFALAVFFGSLLKPHFKGLLPALLVWAAFVAYSRIYLGVHFPLDIVTGALVGAFFGALFARLFNFARLRFLS